MMNSSKSSQKIDDNISKTLSSDKRKNKMISAKVNDVTYQEFTEINKAYGITNNSAINMLISSYVQEKKKILKED